MQESQLVEMDDHFSREEGSFAPLIERIDAIDHTRRAIFEDGKWASFGDLHELSMRVQGALAARGVARGSRILSIVSNGTGFIALLLACMRMGAVLAPLDLGLSSREVALFIETANPSLIVIGDERYANVAEESEATLARISDLLVEPASSESHAAPSPNPDDPCLIVFTSGSTGSPKGVLLPVRSICHAASSLAKGLGLVDSDIVLNALPVCHLFSINAGTLAPLISGAPIVTMPHFQPNVALDLIEGQRASVFNGVPTMYRRLAKEQQEHPRDIGSLRGGYIAGAKCGTVAAYHDILGFTPSTLYGLTEFPVIALEPLNSAFTCDEGKVGSVIDGVSLCFEMDRDDADGTQLGEILCKGPQSMLGYFGNAKKTSEVIDDLGWVHTGDLGYLDKDNRLHVSGRKDDVINKGGNKVFPAEVEAVCLEHSDIVECCVLGMPHDELGEQIVVFAQVGEQSNLQCEDLRKFAQASLSRYKLPDQLVLVQQMPYLHNGKTDKAMLRRLYGMPDDKGRLHEISRNGEPAVSLAAAIA